MFLTIAAAAVMATGASAQMGPADPAAPAVGPAAGLEAAPPAEMAAPAPEAETLVKKDGKWWAGDREATKTEIAEYKKAKKAGKPS